MIFLILLMGLIRVEVFAQDSQLRERPLWDLGVGPFIFHWPHYRGADQGGTFIWPLLDFNYRGEKVQVQNSFVNGNLYQSNLLTLGLSLMATPRVSSGKNQARSGMPGIDPTLEVGPVVTFDFHNWNTLTHKHYLSFNIPFRQVIGVDFWSVQDAGQFVVPFFSWAQSPLNRLKDFYFETTLAVMWGSKQYHHYYFGVDPKFATSNRPSYHGKSGYSGVHSTIFASQDFGDWYAFTFFRYDYLKGAKFTDGPLHRRDHFLAMGLGIIWYFYQSEELSHKRSPRAGLGN